MHMILGRVNPFPIAAAIVACGLSVAAAQLPKGSAVASKKVTATVTEIDAKNRVVTLKTTDGLDYTFVVDPAVKNLAQVKTGDTVVATYTEALAYEVKKGGTASVSGTVGATGAKPGATPAGAVTRNVTITVAITAIDPSVPSVTFTGPQGNSRTVKIKDPSKLKGVSVGDTVEISYTEALALKIEKPADTKVPK
jgi:Cu/Ag efflux protein CusF